MTTHLCNFCGKPGGKIELPELGLILHHRQNPDSILPGTCKFSIEIATNDPDFHACEDCLREAVLAALTAWRPGPVKCADPLTS